MGVAAQRSSMVQQVLVLQYICCTYAVSKLRMTHYRGSFSSVAEVGVCGMYDTALHMLCSLCLCDTHLL
jgi:hypothetical protein